MKGEFTVALAANFIVAGVIASLKGTSAGSVSFGIGLILLLVAYFLRKKQKPSLETAPSTSPVHQDVKQEANPQINAPINISIGNSSSSATAAAPVPVPEKINPEPKCNIEFSDVEPFIETNAIGQPILLTCAIFENKAVPGETLRTPTLRARLIFKHPDGHLVLDISDASWWPENTYAMFSANSPRRLLLFFDPGNTSERNIYARSVNRGLLVSADSVAISGHAMKAS